MFKRMTATIKNMSLRSRFVLLAIVGLLVLGGTLNWLLRESVSRVQMEQLLERGFQVSSDLAIRVQDPLLTDDRYSISRLIDDTRGNVDEILYILILDRQGKLIAYSTRWDGPPSDSLVALGGRGEHIVLDSEMGTVYDVSSPVLGGAAGHVQVGMSTDNVKAVLGALSRFLFLATMGAAALVALLVHQAAGAILRPLKSLQEAAASVAQGNLEHTLCVEGEDELAQVREAFNTMTRALREAKRRDFQVHALRSQLLERVISAQEEERRRISAELHDQTGQILTAVTRQMKAMEDARSLEEVGERSSRVRAQVNQALDRIRQLSYDLRPPVLDDLGLVPATKRALEDIGKSFSLETDFYARDLSERLPAEVETALYRVLQEALINAGRHSGASTVCVGLERHGDKVKLLVEDDGRGFDLEEALQPDESGRGLGLLGMRERMKSVRGQLSVETKPGHGTTVYARVNVGRGGELEDDYPDSAGG